LPPSSTAHRRRRDSSPAGHAAKDRGTCGARGGSGRQRQVVNSFLAASQHADFDTPAALLDPDAVLHVDAASLPTGQRRTLRRAQRVARGALGFAERARFAQPAMVNGSVGHVVAPRGRLFLVLGFILSGDRIRAIEVISEDGRLRELDLAVPAT
jgi:hypothetical protein